MSLYTPEENVLDIPGFPGGHGAGGGGRGGGGGGGRGGGVIRLPGTPSRVPFTRFPRPPRMPSSDFFNKPQIRLPRPPKFDPYKIPQIRMPPIFGGAPNQSRNRAEKLRKNWDSTEKPPLYPGLRIPSAAPFSEPLNLRPGEYKLEASFSGKTDTYWADKATGQVLADRVTTIARIDFIGTVINPAAVELLRAGDNYYWCVHAASLRVNNREVTQRESLGNGLFRITIPFLNGFASNGFEAAAGEGLLVFGGVGLAGLRLVTGHSVAFYEMRSSFTSNIVNPSPWRSNTQSQRTEDMSCTQCQAALALRALQRTITVDSTVISSIPTGNLLVGPTIQKPMRVFALPGTEGAIKNQFDLMDEIKKRLAKTFNQSRMTKVLAKLQQIMSVTDFVLNLHTALMMSSDIIESFWSPITSAVDTIVSVLDDVPLIGALFDLEEKSLNSSEILGNKFQDAMKTIFGAENWAQIQAKWASFNNIVRGAAMQIQAVRDINDSQKQLGEMTASKLGKLHNKMVRAGVIFDSSMWEENVKSRSVWLDKFYKVEELAEDNPVTNAASYVNSWGQQYLDIKEQKKELADSRTKYQEELQKDLQIMTDNKIKTDEASTGSPYTRADGNPPETNND